MTAQKCSWPGVSGQQYSYFVYELGTSLKRDAGNYIFARLESDGWVPVYIGESESLGDRCCGTHEKWDLAIEYGATHIHAHLNADKTRRLDEETDLRRGWNTPCNDQ